MKRIKNNSQKAILSAKMLVIALFFFLNNPVAKSQISATVTGGNCAGTFNLALNGTMNGKNKYSGTATISGFGVPVDMTWSTTNSRWEITGPIVGIVFYNTAATSPNPPCHTNGTWVSASSCAGGAFTASSGDCSTVPVELLGFSVKNVNTANEMTWQTASETQNKGFDIERSNDGKAWQNLGFVAAKGNNSTYSFTDKEPLTVSYYRLRQLDFDGQYDYSKVMVAKSANVKSNVTVFPNPNTEGAIYVQGLTNDRTDISITNVYGQTVFQQTVGTESAVLNVKNVLSTGVYFVHFKANQTVVTQKIRMQ
jgi:hypothetical protein